MLNSAYKSINDDITEYTETMTPLNISTFMNPKMYVDYMHTSMENPYTDESYLNKQIGYEIPLVFEQISTVETMTNLQFSDAITLNTNLYGQDKEIFDLALPTTNSIHTEMSMTIASNPNMSSDYKFYFKGPTAGDFNNIQYMFDGFRGVSDKGIVNNDAFTYGGQCQSTTVNTQNISDDEYFPIEMHLNKQYGYMVVNQVELYRQHDASVHHDAKSPYRSEEPHV